MSRIAVIGTGYVGLVTGVCFADLGNRVLCVDSDRKKIETLLRGESPIFEPGLSELLTANIQRGRIDFTSSLQSAVDQSEILFIAVGTPQNPRTGEADLSFVWQVARQLGRVIRSGQNRTVVVKSTVPVGTTVSLEKRIRAELARRKVRAAVTAVSNPEFLREGSAVRDFMEPDRVVVGSRDAKSRRKISALYKPLGAPVLETEPESSEMIKYASNALLAAKISFINEIANVCEGVGADIMDVARGVGMDKRIGAHFLSAGIGYGGSCFPKDTEALVYIAGKGGVRSHILESVVAVNRAQRRRFLDKIVRFYGGRLKGRRFAVLGLAFKPNTDDMREAPAIDIIRGLVKRGAQVSAYDPVAMSAAQASLPRITYAPDPYAAAQGADAAVILTEWNEFKELDLRKLRRLLKHPVLFDGRNIFPPRQLSELGFQYISVGRAAVPVLRSPQKRQRSRA
ncbi:UDP-glucose/GDP-mannose dehydrogenase family protein [bacterium]|nr:UDP-glucose/GDP-mannose dehydrogenase family protein [bacterium]